MSDEETPVFKVGDRVVNAWGQDAEEPASADQAYSEWSAKQLKAEIDRRNADRTEDTQIVLDGNKKSDAVAALEADDEVNGSGE